jgi:hypothetical protein
MLRIFITVTALGLAGLIGVQHVGERACLPHDLCQIEKATFPDEQPSEIGQSFRKLNDSNNSLILHSNSDKRGRAGDNQIGPQAGELPTRCPLYPKADIGQPRCHVR